MAGTNKLHGIYGNQQFMDHLYRYGEIKGVIESKRQSSAAAEIEKGIEESAKHRVTCVNICLSEIKSKTQGSEEWQTYFDFMRCNQKIIKDELSFYLEQSYMEKHRGTLSACYNLLNYVMNELCNFTHADLSVISEYKHVYNMISCRRQQGKVLLQAGRLFVNFINILTSRYYYEETDIKFADIESQAKFIIDNLTRESTSEFHQQANTVKNVYAKFTNFIELQDGHREIQQELLKKALKLAHAKATETVLQTTKRLILDAISKIQERLRDGLRTAIKVGEAIIYPIRHPVKTAKSVFNNIRHPVQSFKALITWAKENPWKCCAIVVGGMCLGAVGFGGAAYLVDVFIYDFIVTVTPLFVVGGACGGIISPLAVAANRANEMIKDAKKVESNLQTKFESFKKDLNAQGDEIATKALNEDDWWTGLKDVQTEIQIANEADQKIETMDEDQLRQSEKEMNESLTDIEKELQVAHRDIVAGTEDMYPEQEDSSALYRASEILRKRIAVKKYGGNDVH